MTSREGEPHTFHISGFSMVHMVHMVQTKNGPVELGATKGTPH